MGFQGRDQSYSVWPESGELMEHGMVVEICNFLGCFTHYSHSICFISSLLVPGGFTSRARRTIALLHILFQNVRHSRPYQQLWSGQVVTDDRQYLGAGNLGAPLFPLHEPDDGDSRWRLPSWPAVKILSPL